MDINRDNYEEYFLLYADNELTDSEKAEVLMFVKNNKDLEQEFRIIHHTISRPDMNLELSDKSFLFRSSQTSFINETNYEEIFVLYHDNELSENEKLETREFLSLHKELQAEFDLIGLARLTPESAAVFPGKKILYKKERAGKVVPVIFWRMLAAAVFIGFGLWIMNIYFQKPVKSNQTMVQSSPLKSTTPKIEKNIVPEKKPLETVAQPSETTSTNSGTTVNNKKGKQPIFQKNNAGNDIAKNNSKALKTHEEIITRVPSQKISDKIIAPINDMKDISANEILPIGKIGPSEELAQNITRNNETIEPVTEAKNISYLPDADNNNDNYVFYDVTTDKFKKTKVGGFLKKVRRVVERNNPIARLFPGDDRQVASN
jgi:hypothetical protein